MSYSSPGRRPCQYPPILKRAWRREIFGIKSSRTHSEDRRRRWTGAILVSDVDHDCGGSRRRSANACGIYHPDGRPRSLGHCRKRKGDNCQQPCKKSQWPWISSESIWHCFALGSSHRRMTALLRVSPRPSGPGPRRVSSSRRTVSFPRTKRTYLREKVLNTAMMCW